MASLYIAGKVIPSFPEEWDVSKYPIAYVSFTANMQIAYFKVVDRLGRIDTDPDTGWNSYGDGKTIFDDDADPFYNMTWYIALTESAVTGYASLYPGLNTKTWTKYGEEDYSLNLPCDNGPYWSNSNLYNRDGSLFLAGGLPEIYPVSESSGDGFALFNGYKQPKLPTIDSGTHPYVTVQRCPYDDGGYISHVRCSASPFYYDANTKVVTNDGDCVVYDYIDWWNQGSDPVWTGGYTINGGELTLDPSTVIWTNKAMYDSDGNAWLSTSDVIILDGLMVIEWDGRWNRLKSMSLEGRTYFRMSEWTPISSEFAGCYVAVANGTRMKNYQWTKAAIDSYGVEESTTYMYLIDNVFTAHASGKLTFEGEVLTGLQKGLYSCLTLIAYDPDADGGVYSGDSGSEPGESGTPEIEEEPEVVVTLTPAEEHQILLLGWQAGNAIRRTLTQTNVNAVLVNGVLYIRDAEATLTDTTLEVK